MSLIAKLVATLPLLRNPCTTHAISIPRACEPPLHIFPFCNTSLPLTSRIENLLQLLTLEEKVLMLTARASPKGNVPRLGLPEYNWGANCVHGVQSACGENCATSFPNPINLGAAFNVKGVYDMAQVIGKELRALWLEGARENYKNGPHLGLDCWSPNINVLRDARWGRAMESYSEDPHVISKYAVAYTTALQNGEDPRYLQAVVTVKHFAAYSFENYNNIDRKEFNAIVSDYDFADTYVQAFKASVVDGHAKGVMCSYNSVNYVPMCANDKLVRLLRESFGFDGYITTDSNAIEGIFEKRTKSLCEAAKIVLESGVDINSGRAYKKCLQKLVQDNQLQVHFVDDAIRRTLKLRFQLGLFDPIDDQPYWHYNSSHVRTEEALKLSLKLTRQSIVLLKNDGGLLPLKKHKKIAVIGPHATSQRGLMGNYYGQICHGDYKDMSCVQTPLNAIRDVNDQEFTYYAYGSKMNDTSTDGFEEAICAANLADTAILFLGIDTSIEEESKDRKNINLPRIQLDLLKAIRKLGKPIVVVLINGGVVGIEELILYADSVLEAFYPGFFGAQAIAEILFGDINPSGKLPVTMYRSDYIDTLNMESMDMTLTPGRTYRYYTNVPVFPFAWGLSYTTFSLHIDPTPQEVIALVPQTVYTLNVRIQNSGKLHGEEILFAFFRPLSTNATGPATLLLQQLFFFERLSLAPAESTIVTLNITRNTLVLHDVNGDSRRFPGLYEIIVTNGATERETLAVLSSDSECALF